MAVTLTDRCWVCGELGIPVRWPSDGRYVCNRHPEGPVLWYGGLLERAPQVWWPA